MAVAPSVGHVGFRIIQRLVILPEWQGLSLAGRFMNIAGEIYTKSGLKLTIHTSLKSFAGAIAKNRKWRLTRQARMGPDRKKGRLLPGRMLYSFAYSEN